MHRWQVIPDATGGVTLCRPGAARFDFAASTAFPALRPLVLAHEVRKDLWRRLAGLRGFSPVIRVTPQQEGAAGDLVLVAGGQIAVPHWPTRLEDAVAALLAERDKRARWIAHARLR